MIREELTEEDCGLNSSLSISCSFPISLFPSLISNWWNSILWNMPRPSFSVLIAVWNFTFPAPLGNCSLRHAVFFSKFSCSYCLTHLCSPQIYAVKYYSVTNCQAKLFYYKSVNKSALYTPSFNIFLKLSFTAATSSW